MLAGMNRLTCLTGGLLPFVLVIAGGSLGLPMTSASAPAPVSTTSPTTRPSLPPVLFTWNFEGGSLAKVEVVSSDVFRCWVLGQHDVRGHNRQTSWFYFRMDRVAGRQLTLTFTDLIGEYNDRRGAVPYGPDIVPVHSPDGINWTPFTAEEFRWDDAAKEFTLRFSPATDTLYIAHIPPYLTTHLAKLLDDVRPLPHARIEMIGKTLSGRDLQMVTITDFSVPDDKKKAVWLQARQHAWEAGTSWTMDGALRWVVGNSAEAVELRKTTVFRFTPMVDLDGVVAGRIRFNGNGYDVNRNWPSVDLRDPEMLRLMPEIWYTKKALVAPRPGEPMASLVVNLHNTETAEYLQTEVDADEAFSRIERLSDRLAARRLYLPSRPLEKPRPRALLAPPRDTTTSLWNTHGVPTALMELRVSTVESLQRRRTTDDWRQLGAQLIEEMARSVVP
jgi:hypothetical protein